MNSQKNLIQLYDRVAIFFLFVTVNVISPLPRCSSRLTPFCFMKNSNTHACIVSALSLSLEKFESCKYLLIWFRAEIKYETDSLCAVMNEDYRSVVAANVGL